ncbi:biogenesis of lysosome- organelles complex 1 subunit 2 [Bulinus truncatus]|nr:biogenesis of lysosome- organelles complex 1 subunit 2 [Bulinus truncatus]
MAESHDRGPKSSQESERTPEKNKGVGNESVNVENSNGNAGPPADVVELCRESFQKTAEYLRGELDGTIEDYKLLEKMNQITMNKYSEMKQIALGVSGALKDLNDKYNSLQPYLEQIDQIEESVVALEQVAYNLDQYSKKLENKFKALEKR